MVVERGATPTVRAYEQRDRTIAAALLYASSGGMYDRYAGRPELARKVLTRALERERTTASADVVHVAEIDGQVAGAMAAMPYSEWTPRARAFLRVTLTSIPPWHWLGALSTFRLSGRAAPEPPTSSLYVDSLAVTRQLRRRGAGRALLAEAERFAYSSGLDSVSLDVWADNDAARALYRSTGFVEVATTPAARGLPGGVALRKEVRFGRDR